MAAGNKKGAEQVSLLNTKVRDAYEDWFPA